MHAHRQIHEAAAEQIDVSRTEQQALGPFHGGDRRFVPAHELPGDQEGDDRDPADDEMGHPQALRHARNIALDERRTRTRALARLRGRPGCRPAPLGRRASHAASVRHAARRTHGRPRAAETGIAAALRFIQDPRRLQPAGAARRERTQGRRRRLLVRQSRPGRGGRRQDARHPRDHRHARRRAPPQAREHEGARRRRRALRPLPREPRGRRRAHPCRARRHAGPGIRRPAHRGGPGNRRTRVDAAGTGTEAGATSRC